MEKICPKCGYERKEVDTAPDYECPMCGIIYDKFKNQNEDIIKMNQENVEVARKYKKYYVIAFLLLLLSRALDKSSDQYYEQNVLFLFVIAFNVFVVVYVMTVTWKFCRVLEIGKTMSVVNTITSPLLYIFQAVYLLRRYVKTTGIRIGFFLGDKMPKTQTNVKHNATLRQKMSTPKNKKG